MPVVTQANAVAYTRYIGPRGTIGIRQQITTVASGFDQVGQMNLDPRVKVWNMSYYVTVAVTAGNCLINFYTIPIGVTDCTVSDVKTLVSKAIANGDSLFGITPSSGAAGASLVAFAGLDPNFNGIFYGPLEGLLWKITGATAVANAITTPRYLALLGQF